jgi:hypothetical protein
MELHEFCRHLEQKIRSPTQTQRLEKESRLWLVFKKCPRTPANSYQTIVHREDLIGVGTVEEDLRNQYPERITRDSPREPTPVGTPPANERFYCHWPS